jgi:AcrR family transcriptional regulator
MPMSRKSPAIDPAAAASSPGEPAAAAAEAAGRPRRAVDRIRQTARELFYREGIRAVGVDEIVTRAGVTKPSLYRNFASKDELAATYLRDYDSEFWNRFEQTIAAHPGQPRAQLRALFEQLAARAREPDSRGCGLTNAAVEYPKPDHPARLVAQANKRALRQRLIEMSAAIGATSPEVLGDGLLLLMEGAYASGQLFGPGGPAGAVAMVADQLIAAHLDR